MDLLAIGSVVILKESEKKVMIAGLYPRTKNKETNTVICDYVGLLYPEGYISSNMFLAFNQEDIDKVVFEGYKTEEWEAFAESAEKLISSMLKQAREN